jgi:hemolysin D
MTEQSVEEKPKLAQKPSAPARRRDDQEFLPAALEILETPASPVSTWLIFAICSFVVIALTWSWFGRFDIVAMAQGKFQPTGRVKIVQPLETAKVQSFTVQNGTRVRQGDTLVELDASDAVADKNSLASALASTRGEIVRRLTAAKTVRKNDLPDVPKLVWADNVDNDVRLREERVYEAEVARLKSAVAALVAQRAQKNAESKRISETIQAQRQLIEVMGERVGMRSELVKRASGTKASLIDALESYRYQQTSLVGMEGQISEISANIEVINREITKLYDAFYAENSQKLGEAERQRDDLEQRLAKADARLERFTLKAPIDGVVYALTVTTLGQVVVPAEEVMRIVPDGNGLEIEVYIQNKDIGFIAVGQEAVIKVDSFPFIRYGSLPGVVSSISRDAIPEPDAQALESNARQNGRTITNSGGQRVQNLVFPILVKPGAFELDADGEKIPVAPGMTATVEVKTGSRRILEYVFSPLVEVAATSMRER